MTEAAFDEIQTKPQSFALSFVRMMGVLWRPQMKRWRLRMGLALLITLASKGLAVISPVWLGDGINKVAAGESVAAAGSSFVMFFLLFAGSRFLSNGLPQIRDAFFTRVTQDANRLIAVEAFAHAQAQSLQFHLTRRAGALNRIIERGAGAMEFMLRFLAFNIGPTLVELALAAAVMATLYSWKIALAAVATIVVYTGFTVVVTEWRNSLRRLMNEADTELRAISMDTLTNFETVKAFGAEMREAKRYDNAMQVYNDRYVRTMQSLSLLNAGQEFVMTAGLLAAVLIASFAVAGGAMKPGDITAVILMLTNIYRPLNILGFAWREIKQGAVDIEKLFDLLDLKPEIQDAPDARDISPKNGEIRFENVSFVHDGRQSGLKDVSFNVRGGAFVGLAGPSGAGKSTILKLLFRFYDPASGRILIDGQDLKDVRQTSLRTALGLVPQEVVLFNDTLRFNLSYARPDASEAEIMDAARRAQLGEFIAGLPKGLDTRVGERGLKLSGGEKQRVGVARAILLDPWILVLDEATSSLDSETEKEVQAALAEAAKGRTTIAVAHRLSTIAGADLILVLDEGRIVEQGRHDELIARNGLYAALWRRQTANESEALTPHQPQSDFITA
ncbi:MAG: ABC transporter ATP-binding protein/permease [Pseudomonadota bacterium]|nr:ABC transporter ATP-binding protein/permease [Pseudomonadota bacterium]